MAFVPRVHNRQVPTANQAVFVRSSLEEQRKHRLAVERMRPAIDNKWGQMHNGVRETKRATYPHVKINLKRAQLEDERAQAIEMENFHLLEKLSKILERPLNPTRGGTREWGGGVRLDSHQVPVIDHQVPAKTTTFGAAVEATSLNIGMRERQQNEIVTANHKLVKRIQMCKPTYDRQKQMAAEKERERWLWNQAIANRPLDASGPPRPISAVSRRRPASASAALTAPPGMPALAAPAHSGAGASGSGPPPANKPVRPSTARPAKLKRAPSEMDRRAQADASVLKVLDLLSAQRSKITSLKELRAQKDVLMAGVYSAPGDISTELIETSGIVIHVTSSPACKPGSPSSSDQLVVLVHGGLFMSGSPQASAHLAAKLCQQLGVAVATPQLRLAPEHPFPAASDDLKAAYEYLSQYGVDPHRRSPPPTKIALYAESSGGALAVGLLQSLKAQGATTEARGAIGALPACVGLVSPWLDLTCEGGSYVVNEAYDLMMRRDRLHGIATAYMAGGAPLSDPSASPLLAPDGPEHFRMPPTLVHVCKNELLLDDALTYGEYCLAQGTDIKVQQFDHALHAWHTYFPLMPVAEQALGEMAGFFKGHLFADAA